MATKTVFDHVNAIYTNQSTTYFDELEDSDTKTFSPYMVNRIISMNLAVLPVVNEVQKYLNEMSARDTYLFYSQLLPKGKRFDKYVKSQKTNPYEPWLVSIVAEHFQISLHEATEYCDIYYLSERGKAELLGILEAHGTDPKHIKKAHLDDSKERNPTCD